MTECNMSLHKHCPPMDIKTVREKLFKIKVSPTYEDSNYYDRLIRSAAQELGISAVMPAGQAIYQERKRLLWYFIAQETPSNPSILGTFRETLKECAEKGEAKHNNWMTKWLSVIEEVEAGNINILYEKSDMLQKLRDLPPFDSPEDILSYQLTYAIDNFILEQIPQHEHK